jgi:predicted O-methyltransferase YrrM
MTDLLVLIMKMKIIFIFLPRSPVTLTTLLDPPVAAVVERLHAESARQRPGMVFRLLPRLPHLALGHDALLSPTDSFYKDKILALDPSQAAFLHTLVRSVRAQSIVEFGTSCGVSTLWLAAAARTNWGKVVSCEIVPEKAAQARANLSEAGLLEVVEVRVGDALETLASLEGPVDFVFLDGFPSQALAVLQLLLDKLAPGATVIAQDVGFFRATYAEYLAWIRDPTNGFVTSTIPFRSGLELSVYQGTSTP